MKIVLNDRQRTLAEDNLSVVQFVIRGHTDINENAYGLGRDDLYQEGCLWLCKAAATFDESKGVKFKTYAEKVVANGLRTYIRLMNGKQKHIVSLPVRGEPNDEEPPPIEQFPGKEWIDDLIARVDILPLLATMKQQNCGTVRLGIEAIELKVKGFSGAEIAKMYGVKSNLVGAWISRAAKKIKETGMLTGYLPRAG